MNLEPVSWFFYLKKLLSNNSITWSAHEGIRFEFQNLWLSILHYRVNIFQVLQQWLPHHVRKTSFFVGLLLQYLGPFFNIFVVSDLHDLDILNFTVSFSLFENLCCLRASISSSSNRNSLIVFPFLNCLKENWWKNNFISLSLSLNIYWDKMSIGFVETTKRYKVWVFETVSPFQ